MQRVAALDPRGRDKLMPAVRPRRPANRSPSAQREGPRCSSAEPAVVEASPDYGF